MKLEDGENRLRILSEIIVGTEYWVEVDGNRKPKRVQPNVKIPMGDVTVNQFGNPSISAFWSMVVWNYSAKQVQILNITQKDIMKSMLAYKKDADWGDLTKYDLVITREKGERVKYTVIAKPHRELDADIKKTYEGMEINLDNLYVSEKFPYGGDPFAEKIEVEEVENEFAEMDAAIDAIN
jgi:hypothetical protein